MSLNPVNIDRAIAGSPLVSDEAALIYLFAAAVKNARTADRVLERFAAQSVPNPGLMLELMFQLPLFAGFPRTINVLASLRRHYGFEAEVGPIEIRPSDDALMKRGRALFGTIYADNTERVLSDLDRLHPELKEWILREAYGFVLSREAMSPRLREMAACAALVVSEDLRQLSSHARGVLHCKGTTQDLEAALALTEDLAHPEVLNEARAIVERL